MKLLIVLLFMLPFALFGQNSQPYLQTMGKFQLLYNAAKDDSLNAMFGHEWDEMQKTKPLWTKGESKKYLEEYGKLISFKFIGFENKDSETLAIFRTVFSKKGKKVTSISLNSENKLGTFRFSTGSESKEINRLLRSS